MTLMDLQIDIGAILPEILLACLSLTVLVLEFFLPARRRALLNIVGIAGLILIVPVVLKNGGSAPTFGGTVIADDFSIFFRMLFIAAGALTLAFSINYNRRTGGQRGEYTAVILFATLGMMVMASAHDLVSIYVGLELMALSFYVLVALGPNPNRSVEAALKYFILDALSSGILLFGLSFAYGFSGTTNLAEMARQAAATSSVNPFLLLAMVLILSGFAFKVAMFPFHLWAPDAYEGAPTPIAALLSVGSKAAAFAVFMRIFLIAWPDFQPQWSQLMWLLSAATMIFGSVVAISQRNIIRMMAYSSIAHAGMIIIGLLVYSRGGMSGVLYYLLVYTFMNLGVFAVVAMTAGGDGTGLNIDNYKGLASRHPWAAFSMALFLLALAGVPPTGGFTAKFFIFAAAVNAGYYGLVVLGVAATAVALFFYARVIYFMYMQEPEKGSVHPGSDRIGYAVLMAAAVGTLLPGLYPGPFMEFAINAVEPFLK